MYHTTMQYGYDFLKLGINNAYLYLDSKFSYVRAPFMGAILLALMKHFANPKLDGL